MSKKPQNATLYVCGLGLGVYYLNGKRISDDLLTAPVSDYNKTLWYSKYEVGKFLTKGENVFCVILGNGMFNECLKTYWDYDTAIWRDNPKLICKLEADGEAVMQSDKGFLCSDDGAITFNQLNK